MVTIARLRSWKSPSILFFVMMTLAGCTDSSVNVKASSALLPVAISQSVTVGFNASQGIQLGGTGSNGLPLASGFTVVANPQHGVLGGTAPNLSYTPTHNFSGTDSFTFMVTDGTESSVESTVTISVTSQVPVANPQSVDFSMTYVPIYPILLAGTPTNGNSVVFFTIATAPSHGSLSSFSTPNLLYYTPNNGYAGSDSFTFTMNDGSGDSAPALFALLITQSPQAIFFENDCGNSPPDSNWNTVQNWWVNTPCGTLAGHTPTSSNYVYLVGGVAPATGPSSPLTISGFDTSGLNTTIDNGSGTVTQNLTISPGGTLYVGRTGDSFGLEHGWFGTTTDSSDFVVFQGAGSNYGTINGAIVFSYWGSAANENGGVINGNMTMDGNGDAGGTVNGNAVFTFNVNWYGTVTGDAIFDGFTGSYAAGNDGAILGNAAFNQGSYNQNGTVGGNAVFNQTSTNQAGQVSGNAIFNDSSTNDGGVVDGQATFNGASTNGFQGSVLGNVIFNGGASNSGGTYGGTCQGTNGQLDSSGQFGC